MSTHALAGKPAPADFLVDVQEIERAYYERKPDVDDPIQLVSFGTSGVIEAARSKVLSMRPISSP
jgi:hypothetical protein